MSIMDVLKKDLGGGKKKDSADTVAPAGSAAPAETPVDGKPGKAPKQAKAAKGTAATLSASPRANLMPPEIGENHRKRATRRSLRLLIIAVLVFVIAGAGGAWFYATSTQAALTAAQSEQQSLLLEQGQYSEVRTTKSSIALGTAAQQVGASTEIDWSAYIAELQSTLPADVNLTDINVDAADPITPFGQSDIPLEGERIATLTFTAETLVLPSIPDWVDRLSGMDGFADASPSSVDFSDGVYHATVTMHINQDAFANRYAPTTEEAAK